MADPAIIENLRAQIRSVESGHGSDTRSKKSFSMPDAATAHPSYPNTGRTCKAPEVTDEADRESHLDESSAFHKIVALINASEKSETMIRERLAKAGYGPAAIDEGVGRALEYRIIDDERYARTLIRSRMNQGMGIRGIERELERNNIDPYSIDGWPEEFTSGEDSEVDRALSLLQRKPVRSKNKREGAYRKLMQKGYSSSAASTAARIWSEGSC